MDLVEEKREERKSKIVPRLSARDKEQIASIEHEGGRVFTANGVHCTSYAGPSPKCLYGSQISDDVSPAYIDANGVFYNKSYEELDIDLLRESGALPENDVLSAFPKAENFTSFEDYDGAVMQWKVEAAKSLGHVKLPRVLGSVFFRPSQGTSGINSDLEFSESTSISEDDHSEVHADSSPRSKGSPRAKVGTPSASEGGTEGDIDDSDLFDRKWLLERDPWAASLIPFEPDPMDFDDFEAYETAMHNWGKVCARCAVLPPSPDQMERILGLTIQEDEDNEDTGLRVSTVLLAHTGEEAIEETVFQPRTALLWVSDKDDELYSGFEVKPPPCLVPHFDHFGVQEERDRRSSMMLGKIDAAFQGLLKKRIANATGPFHQFHAPDPGRTHFVVGLDKAAFGGSRSDSVSSPIRRGRTQKKEPEKSSQDPLRRLDLKFQDIVAHSDIPDRMEGTCAFYPQTSIDHVDLDQMQRPSGRQKIRAIVDEINYSLVQDPLYSWYHPLTRKTKLDELKAKASQMLVAKKGQPLTVEEMMSLFSVGAYLDEIDEFLSAEVTGLLHETSFLKELMNTVTTETLPRVLAVDSFSNTRLVHASVAHFLTQVVQQGKLGKQLVAHVVDARDFQTLYRLSLAFSMLHHSQTEIWPFNETLIASARMGMKSEDSEICMTILLIHYVDCICNRMSDNAYMFVSVLEYIKAVRTAELVSLASNLAINLEFISKTIFALLNHRVRRICTFGLFLMIQLLGFTDIQDIVSSIQAEETDFLNHVRRLAKSKKLHAQNAARRLYSFMQQNAVWRPFLHGFYNRFELAVIDDLCSTHSDGSPSVLSSMALNMCQTALASVKRLGGEAAAKQISRIGFVMKGGAECLFHHLFKIVTNDRKVNNPTTAHVTLVMDQVASEFRRRSMISGGEGNQRPRGVGRNLPVSAHDLMMLVEMASTIKCDTVERREAKAHLIRTARQLTMSPEPFESMKKELSFYLNVLQMCRDGDAPAANKEAWKLMYTIIRYHGGVVAWMESNHKLLNSLIEIVSIGASMTVVRNSLYYFAKLLDLSAKESELVFNNIANSRGELELKSYEKDLKIINSYIVTQSKWIKFHMIYKKLAGQGFAGQAFLALVQLFATIDKHKISKPTGGEKLYKEISKTPEYVQGIQSVMDMMKKPVVSSRPMSRSLSISRVNAVKKT